MRRTQSKPQICLYVIIIYTKFIYHYRFGFAAEFAPRNIIRSEVRCRTTGALRKVWDFKSEQDLYDILVDFIHNIYFKYALLSPKDRAIVVVESLLCPTLFRETLAKVKTV